MAMASSPNFFVIPRLGFGSLSVANTDYSGATTSGMVDILTGVTAGTKIVEIAAVATVDPADSVVNLFLHDGTGYRYWDSIDLGNPVSSTVALPGFRDRRLYDNLVLPSASWKLAAAITVAPTSGVVNVFAMGADAQT